MGDKSSTSNSLSFTLPPRLFETKNDSASIILKCVDCHAGGEPARVVLSGVPAFPKGSDTTTALLKRSYMMEHLDHLRKILLLEPRGYPCQNANFVFDESSSSSSSSSPSRPLQYVIAEQNKIYPLMSGHNTICVATALLECGVIPQSSQEPTTKFTLEAPAGPIHITAKCQDGKAISIAFTNAPSFAERMNLVVEVPHGIGPVTVDIAYGGMWYAVVDLEQFQTSTTNTNPVLQTLRLQDNMAAELCRVGEMIKVACREQFPVQHPTEDYPGVDILVFRGPATPGSGAHAKNAVVMSNNVLDWEKPETWTAMLDRSPCGTGTCAVMAVLHARGQLQVGEPFVHESIVGSKFTGTILQETTLQDGRSAIIPQIEGSAYIAQYSEVVVDPTDPFPEGYRVADIW
jgi:proline racemase